MRQHIWYLSFEPGMFSFTWPVSSSMVLLLSQTSCHVFLPTRLWPLIVLRLSRHFWQVFFFLSSPILTSPAFDNVDPHPLLILFFLGPLWDPIPSQSPTLSNNLTTSSLWSLRLRMLQMLAWTMMPSVSLSVHHISVTCHCIHISRSLSADMLGYSCLSASFKDEAAGITGSLCHPHPPHGAWHI